MAAAPSTPGAGVESQALFQCPPTALSTISPAVTLTMPPARRLFPDFLRPPHGDRRGVGDVLDSETVDEEGDRYAALEGL